MKRKFKSIKSFNNRDVIDVSHTRIFENNCTSCTFLGGIFLKSLKFGIKIHDIKHRVDIYIHIKTFHAFYGDGRSFPIHPCKENKKLLKLCKKLNKQKQSA